MPARVAKTEWSGGLQDGRPQWLVVTAELSLRPDPTGGFHTAGDRADGPGVGVGRVGDAADAASTSPDADAAPPTWMITGAAVAWLGTSSFRASNLDEGLLALVEIRASQINQCAWCLEMHVEEARRAGLQPRQIDLVAAWREAGNVFDERQRAALAFTEAVTLVSANGVCDEVWTAVASVFDEKETVQLLMAIATINVWNRMNVAVRTELPDHPYGPG